MKFLYCALSKLSAHTPPTYFQAADTGLQLQAQVDKLSKEVQTLHREKKVLSGKAVKESREAKEAGEALQVGGAIIAGNNCSAL